MLSTLGVESGRSDKEINRHRNPFSLICISMAFCSVYLCLFVFLIYTSMSALSSFSKRVFQEALNLSIASFNYIFLLHGAFKFARGS